MQDIENDERIKRYIEVCNQALIKNKNRFPFKQILGAAAKAHGETITKVIIGRHTFEYRLKLSTDKIVISTDTGAAENSQTRLWKVESSYLDDVTKNPESYIRNPAKLDWSWMFQAP